MTYFPPEVVEAAKSIDLFTYLSSHDPYELVHFSGNTYTTRTHDSLKISNGKWMWWSRGIGGKSALDYLIKVRGETFLSAMELLSSHTNSYRSMPSPPKERNPERLLLPEKSPSNDRVFEYLLSRGIHYDIIQACIDQGLIFESLPFHNVVFLGHDESNIPRYASYRGTSSKRFMGDATGSDKTYSFHLTCNSSTSVHLFESAIDLLSYATLLQLSRADYTQVNLISLAGVYQPNKDPDKFKVPKALEHFLQKHPSIHHIYFHLDNDTAGRAATKAIMSALSPTYEKTNAPSPYGKDINDYLCNLLGLMSHSPASERNSNL